MSWSFELEAVWGPQSVRIGGAEKLPQAVGVTGAKRRQRGSSPYGNLQTMRQADLSSKPQAGIPPAPFFRHAWCVLRLRSKPLLTILHCVNTNTLEIRLFLPGQKKDPHN